MLFKNPSEKELERLGISRFTYESNQFHKSKIAGLCYWNTIYSCYYFFAMFTGIISGVGFGIGAALEGEFEAFLEFLHFVPLLMNATSSGVAFHYLQNDYLYVFRSLKEGLFDYEGTLDEETKKEMIEFKTQSRVRKQKFASFYTNVLIAAFITQSFKKPLNFFENGHGKKLVDGENNLVWEAPFGLYIPYASYWGPYIFIEIIGWTTSVFCAYVAVAQSITYQFICEELIAEYSGIDLSLRRSVSRAERLYRIKNNINEPEKVTMDDCLRKCLTISIKHHQQTLALFGKVKRLLFVPLFFSVFDSGLVLCISAFIMISDDVSTKLKLAMPPVIVAEIGIALLFCYYGEELVQKNKSIGYSIYSGHGWINHHEIVKPYALLVKVYCDIPNQLSAGGFCSVNLMAFANILQAAYSYIGLLLSTT